MKVFQTASDKFVGSVILYKGNDDKIYKDKELTEEITDEDLLQLFKTNNVLINEIEEEGYTLKKIISVTVDDEGHVTYSTSFGGGEPVASNDVIFNIEAANADILDFDDSHIVSKSCNKTYSEIVEMFNNGNVLGMLNLKDADSKNITKYLETRVYHIENEYAHVMVFEYMWFDEHNGYGRNIRFISVGIFENNEIMIELLEYKTPESENDQPVPEPV